MEIDMLETTKGTIIKVVVSVVLAAMPFST